jgi:hypothetical protein
MADEPEPQAAMMTDAEEPLVLVGPPSGVRGQFRLENRSDQKVIVRAPRMRPALPPGTGKKTAALQTLSEEPMIKRRIIMRPGQSKPIPVALTLDPRTPPGTYHAELDINGQQRMVVMHVTEDVSLSIEPETLVLASKPGEKVKKRVIFTNNGNVAISVRSLGTVVLDEELVHCRALRGVLTDVGDTAEGLDDILSALAKRYRKLYETLVLKVSNTSVTVEPGQTVAVDLTITLPEKLEPRSRYTGYAAISTSTLNFVIVPD